MTTTKRPTPTARLERERAVLALWRRVHPGARADTTTPTRRSLVASGYRWCALCQTQPATGRWCRSCAHDL